MANQPRKPPVSIPFDQFTESTLAAVFRAVEAQKLPHRPIIIGIIFNPQGLTELTSTSVKSER
jgi:hypothetical protein